MRQFGAAAMVLLICGFANGRDEQPTTFKNFLEKIENGNFHELPQLRRSLQSNTESQLTEKQQNIVEAATHYVLGDSTEALKYLEAERGECNSAVACLFARCIASTGRENEIADAIGYLLNGEVNASTSAAASTTLSMLYLSNKQYKDAETWATKAVSLDENYTDALYFRGLARWQQGKTKVAVEDLQRGLSIRKRGPYRNESTPHLVLGMYYAKSARDKRAIESFESALQFEPNSKHACESLWKLHSKLKQHDKAMVYAKNLATLAPNSPVAVVANARTLMSMSRVDEAMPFLEKWIEKSPESPIANQLMSHALSRQGKVIEAFEFASISKSFAPTENPSRSAYVAAAIQVVRQDKLAELNLDKASLEEELCQMVKQLCSDTNWQNQLYLKLALMTYNTFGLEEDRERVKEIITRIAYDQYQTDTIDR